jgi:hypothetical protein
MTCGLCSGAILPGDVVNQHHPIRRSEGGTFTNPTHKACHVAHHSEGGDFREWGREGGLQAALTKRWSLNLRNVKGDPLYDAARQFHVAFYAH